MPRRRPTKQKQQPRETFKDIVADSFKKERVTARSPNQQEYINAIKSHDIVICVGCPGTGKTRISVGLGVEYLEAGKIDKIVITRPLVGAGEDPGALPGGVEQKIHPYLLPIFDEMKYFASKSQVSEWKKSKTIDICPLAYTRGRTFKNSFVILDEAQNATYAQIKMLVTRLGEGSKILINGDINQTDLNQKQSGGLSAIINILEGLRSVKVCYFDKSDIVRHHLLKDVMERFEEYEQKQKKN